MTSFNSEYFKKNVFSKEQVSGYLASALRDLEIASKDNVAEVRFTFAYQAFLKAAITCVAARGYKARSVQGHHIRLIETLSDLLKDPDIFTFGNAMRMKRNEDLYGDGGIVSKKEADEYLEFVKSVLRKVERSLK